MIREFNLDSEKSQEFLRYLLSAMRNPLSGMIEGDGSGHWENNLYISEQAGDICLNNNKVFVHWKIVHNSSCELISVENTFGSEDSKYELMISNFLSDIYEKVISKPKNKFFQRRYFRTISGSNLPGEYWINGFRFAPLYPDDDSTHCNAERIVVIDQEVEAVDVNHARDIADYNSKTSSAYLSLILDIPLEPKRHEEVYFLTKTDAGDFSMKRHSTQLIDTTRITTMPQKGHICSTIKFEGSIFNQMKQIGKPLYCPTETRKVFKGLNDTDDEIKNTFTKCSLMYQLGANIGYAHPTVKTSYEYGAIDTIIHSNKKEYKGFSDFMTRYAGENKDLYDFIHSKIRSAHWHAGEFNLGEFQSKEFSIHSPNSTLFIPIMETHNVLRKAILNWLDEKIRFRIK